MRGMVLFEVEIGAAHLSTEGVSFTRHVLIEQLFEKSGCESYKRGNV